ncbi:MAG: dTDP-4-dehydrorhamnose 3,5-epimerase [Flavobacteriaceae bacterium]|nr:dTDP-4-dehydrorhamnose 3,5-epimerase [Flavobacteriaceae bacterium]
MIFKRLSINDVIEITPSIYDDHRGSFMETYRKDLLDKFIGYKINFCQENQSVSKNNVFRGLHYQLPPYDQTKLVKVIDGKIIDVIIDLRKKSKFFLKSIEIEISEENKKQILIPKGFAHGFLVISEKATIVYKVDSFYKKSYERILNPLDPSLNLKMDLTNKILSEKDKTSPYLKNIDFFEFQK